MPALSASSRIPPLAADVTAFLVDREARNLSLRTVAWYEEKLSIFRRFMEAQGLRELRALTPDVLRRYLLWLSEQGHNRGGVNGCYRALRAFIRWWIAENEPADYQDPTHKVPAPKLATQIAPSFSLADVQALLRVCETTRDRAIVLCLLDSGVRATEFCALTVGDVDMMTGAVRVLHGKGDKGRVTYLGAKARRALSRYLRERRPLCEDASLWLDNAGRPMTANTLGRVCRRLGARAHVAHSHPHTFRRTFALWALRAGMDVYRLQALMGHADMETLRRYLALVDTDAQEAHRRHGPVDTML